MYAEGEREIVSLVTNIGSAMTISKPLLLCLLLILLHLVHANDQELSNMGQGSHFVATKDCAAACTGRCRLSSRQNLCKRACGTCCTRCNCVPPGTSGNQELCACYYAMTTHGGRRKCP